MENLTPITDFNFIKPGTQVYCQSLGWGMFMGLISACYYPVKVRFFKETQYFTIDGKESLKDEESVLFLEDLKETEKITKLEKIRRQLTEEQYAGYVIGKWLENYLKETP